MPDWAIVALIAAGVILLIALVAWAARRGSARRIEKKREQSAEHRYAAQERARQAGEAELGAQRYAEAARIEREKALEHEEKAVELDPDMSSSNRRSA